MLVLTCWSLLFVLELAAGGIPTKEEVDAVIERAGAQFNRTILAWISAWKTNWDSILILRHVKTTHFWTFSCQKSSAFSSQNSSGFSSQNCSIELGPCPTAASSPSSISTTPPSMIPLKTSSTTKRTMLKTWTRIGACLPPSVNGSYKQEGNDLYWPVAIYCLQ